MVAIQKVCSYDWIIPVITVNNECSLRYYCGNKILLKRTVKNTGKEDSCAYFSPTADLPVIYAVVTTDRFALTKDV